MVGEIRAPDTATIAVQAGLTGHLVISTIHSGIAAGVFARLINMEIEPFLLASSIIAVLGIRLIRKNCTYCSEPYQPEAGLLRSIPEDMAANTKFLRGTGCKECLNNGFKGRSAVPDVSGLHLAPNGNRADKSGYTLWNPTPASLMRELSADRPDKTDSAYTVDAGHYQLEIDLVNWTLDRHNPEGRNVRLSVTEIA